MNYGQRFVTLYRRQGSRPSPKKEKQKAKWLSEKALQIAVKRREVKSKGEKERLYFRGLQNQMVIAAIKLKDACSLGEKL